MITLPRKPQAVPEYQPGPLQHAPPPPAPQPVVVQLDNSQLAMQVAELQQQVLDITLRVDSAITSLADAVQKLNPGQSFTVTVTDWTPHGRIRTVKIVKE